MVWSYYYLDKKHCSHAAQYISCGSLITWLLCNWLVVAIKGNSSTFAAWPDKPNFWLLQFYGNTLRFMIIKLLQINVVQLIIYGKIVIINSLIMSCCKIIVKSKQEVFASIDGQCWCNEWLLVTSSLVSPITPELGSGVTLHSRQSTIATMATILKKKQRANEQ